MSIRSFFQRLFGKRKRRRDDPVRFVAPGNYSSVLARAFAEAQAALEPRGYRHAIAKPITLRLETGTARKWDGYWAGTDIHTGEEYAARTSPSLIITLVVQPNGRPNQGEYSTLRHECGHCILYSCGVDGHKHHDILRTARIYQ